MARAPIMTERTGARATLRVLEVLGNAITGGMEHYVENLLANAPPWLVPTIVVPYASRLTERWIGAGHRLHFSPIDDDGGLLGSVSRLVELARRTRADIIHSHLANANAVATIASALGGLPLLATLHGQQLTMRDVEMMHLGNAHGLVVCESALAQALLFGIARDRVTWIRNGVDVQRFMPPAQPRDDRMPLTIGFVGRLAAEKGPLEFVRLARILAERHRTLRFAMFGDGPMGAAVEQMIAREGLRRRVAMCGVVDDMAAAYHALDIVVSTSRTEGSPLALLEAMASGLPIVAPRVGGVAEIVCDGVTGFMPSLGCVEVLAECIDDLIADPARRRAMGMAARERVARLYSAREHLDSLTALLVKVAGRDPAEFTEGLRGELRLAHRTTVANA